MRKTNQIDIKNPEALSIAREIRDQILSLDNKKEELESQMKAFAEQLAKDIDENYERLRRSLNMPELVSPVLDFNYIDAHQMAFVHHGIREGEASVRDIILRDLGILGPEH